MCTLNDLVCTKIECFKPSFFLGANDHPTGLNGGFCLSPKKKKEFFGGIFFFYYCKSIYNDIPRMCTLNHLVCTKIECFRPSFVLGANDHPTGLNGGFWSIP